MTLGIPFPHHTYQSTQEAGHFEFVDADHAAAITPVPELTDVADAFRASGVVEVLLLHGTFTGNDVVGLMRELARFSPRLANLLKGLGKSFVDQVAGELGNYSRDFAKSFSKAINSPETANIPVTCFPWSGENHHLGRAGGAVALLDYLATKSYSSKTRVLIWGHSHGGNVVAMLSQLLGAGQGARAAFFDATRLHFNDPVLRRTDLPQWERVRKLLTTSETEVSWPQIDVVTFGTPLRYRWHRSVKKLLHFVQHRTSSGDNVRAALPKSLQQLREATGGDYVQQFGIGGTDFLHSIVAWRSWMCEQRLWKMFEPSIRRRDLARYLQHGQRVSLDGKTLLVDYPDTPERWNRKQLGHGVYTRPEWLAFHLREVTREFYSPSDAQI